MPWPCFMVVESGRSAAYLRRYASKPCPSMPGEHSYHQAMTRVEDIPTFKTAEGYYASTPVENYTGDERWPKTCSCGYEFDQSNFGEGFGGEADVWQVMTHAIYVREDGSPGGEWSVRDLPPGAMFDTHWLPSSWSGPDGRSISVVLPPDEGPDRMNHVWHVDGPSSSGGHWAREGTPPNLTVSPSILTDRYHGFLQGGVLTDSLADRPL